MNFGRHTVNTPCCARRLALDAAGAVTRDNGALTRNSVGGSVFVLRTSLCWLSMSSMFRIQTARSGNSALSWSCFVRRSIPALAAKWILNPRVTRPIKKALCRQPIVLRLTGQWQEFVRRPNMSMLDNQIKQRVGCAIQLHCAPYCGGYFWHRKTLAICIPEERPQDFSLSPSLYPFFLGARCHILLRTNRETSQFHQLFKSL